MMMISPVPREPAVFEKVCEVVDFSVCVKGLFRTGADGTGQIRLK